MREQVEIKRIPFENFKLNEEGEVVGLLEGRSYEQVYALDTEEMAILTVRASIGSFDFALGPAVIEQPKGSGRLVNIDLENDQNLGDRWVYVNLDDREEEN